MTWVGPETVTSLIEAHGTDPSTMLQPGWQGEAGWPVLLPLAAVHQLRAVGADLMPPDVIDCTGGGRPVAGRRRRAIRACGTTPKRRLRTCPPYEGPPEPPGGHTHEWGDNVADRGVVEDVPGEGRGLAPFPQAGDDTAVDPG